MRIPLLLAMAAAGALAACGGSLPEPPTGRTINTPGFEAYVTRHNGYTRSRHTPATDAADAAILRSFDTVGKAEGYANLFARTPLPADIQIEVIAQVENGVPTRILRLTADQGPFDNLDARNQLVAGPDSTEVYHYRGDATVYARIDDGPLMVGTTEKDTNFQVDFARQTVNLELRTGVNAELGSQLRSEIVAKDMPFDIVGGTFGGPILLRVWSPDSEDVYRANGYLRANIAATNAELRDHLETSTASGVFTATGQRLTADGVFWATHPNAR